jgi:hypothetical protein
MIVYLLRNVINGKCYVGQTITSLEERWSRLSRGRWNKNKYRSDFGKHRVGKALRNIRAALKRRSDA